MPVVSLLESQFCFLMVGIWSGQRRLPGNAGVRHSGASFSSRVRRVMAVHMPSCFWAAPHV